MKGPGIKMYKCMYCTAIGVGSMGAAGAGAHPYSGYNLPTCS